MVTGGEPRRGLDGAEGACGDVYFPLTKRLRDVLGAALPLYPEDCNFSIIPSVTSSHFKSLSHLYASS